MRASSLLLGLLGGLAGLVVHAVLLVRFFSQAHGLFQVFLQLTLAAVLGLAAILVAALCRRSMRALAVLLPVIGALGFFPEPLSWAPAGALLIVGGALALVSLRRGSRYATPTTRQALVAPDGTPLHWSEAARLGMTTAPAQTATPFPRDNWSRARKTGVAAAALVAAAVVVPVSLWSPWSPSAASTTTTYVALETTTTLPPVAPSTTITEPPVTTTTVGPVVTTTTLSPESQVFDTYRDGLRGISINYPREWRNTDPSDVGERVWWEEDRVFRDEWSDAYVAAAFADWQGPTLDGCYLDYIWVEVHNDVVVDPSMIPDFRAWLEDWVVELGRYYSDVRVLEPVQQVVVSGLPGLVHTWTVFVNGYTLVTRECVLLADDCYYFLEFTTVEDDWDHWEPLFRQILEDFEATGSSQLI